MLLVWKKYHTSLLLVWKEYHTSLLLIQKKYHILAAGWEAVSHPMQGLGIFIPALQAFELQWLFKYKMHTHLLRVQTLSLQTVALLLEDCGTITKRGSQWRKQTAGGGGQA